MITDIDGQDTAEVTFEIEANRTVNLTLPRPFKALDAQLNISGAPSSPGGAHYPQNVSIDIGKDGAVDWAFTGPGHGPLGRQDRFIDGATSKDLLIKGATSETYELLLPKGSTVKEASLNLTGIRSPTTRILNESDAVELAPSIIINRTIPGIDQTKIALNASVELKGTVAIPKAMDIEQGASNSGVLFTSSTYSAQSFRVNRTDPRQKHVTLYSVIVGYSDMSTFGLILGLDIYNTSAAFDFQPKGDWVARTTATESNIVGQFVNFTFDPPVQLEPDHVYSMVFGHDIMGGTSSSGRYFDSGTGSNDQSKYPVDGCYMHKTTNGGSTWTSQYGSDWAFKTITGVARVITPQERSALSVDGNAPTGTNGTDPVFNIGPRYNSSGWSFNVSNLGGNEVLFNISASLDYTDAPDHVAIDIGADGAVEATYLGNLSSTMVLKDLKASFITALDKAITAGKGLVDAYCNTLVPIPVKLSASGAGSLRMDDLSIVYDHTAKVPALASDLDGYQATLGKTGPTPLVVPVNVHSSSAGKVMMSVFILLDGPPEPSGAAPSGLKMPEEGYSQSLLDVTDLFKDDFDDVLNISIMGLHANGTVNGSVNVTIGDGGSLVVDLRKATNWTGTVGFRLNATDSNGFSAICGPINITVTNVNDPPVILTTPTRNATVGKVYRYNFSFADSDSSNLNIWLEKAPLTMDLDRTDRTLVWTPGKSDVGTHNFSLKVSDGQLTDVQNISIRVTQEGGGPGQNLAPIVTEISNRTIYAGEDLSLQVSATDPEQGVLSYELLSGPNGMTINRTTGLVDWRSATVGNYTAAIRVSDGQLWTDISFHIAVNDRPPGVKPNIIIDHPTSGEAISGPLTLLGRATATGTKVAKVEYCIDEDPWSAADLMPDGSWSAEASTKGLTKGTHTLVVRATDLNGLQAQVYTTFEIKGSKDPKPSFIGDLLSLELLLIFVLLICCIVVVATWARSRGKGKAARPAAPEGAKAKKAPDRAKAVDVPTKPTEGPIKDIDSAFLVYHDGRLITYSSLSQIADLDATLQVIKDFVKASFRGDVGRLDSLRYENMNVILERGVQMYLVVITPEEDNDILKGLRRKMRGFLGEVHERYRHILKTWDGKYKTVKPIEKMVEDLVNGKWSYGTAKGATKLSDGPDDGHKAPPSKDEKSKRWDSSLDIDDNGLSRIEKQKLLQDRLTRGEISEDEYERLRTKLD